MPRALIISVCYLGFILGLPRDMETHKLYLTTDGVVMLEKWLIDLKRERENIIRNGKDIKTQNKRMIHARHLVAHNTTIDCLNATIRAYYEQLAENKMTDEAINKLLDAITK